MDDVIFMGTEKAFTAYLDTTTSTAVAADPKQIIGKAVAITGNKTVGYGSAGDPLVGIVDPSVEPYSTNDKRLVVCVRRFRMFDEVSYTGSVSAGNYVAVNGSGGVQASSTSTSATVWDVNATNNTCTILVL